MPARICTVADLYAFDDDPVRLKGLQHRLIQARAEFEVRALVMARGS